MLKTKTFAAIIIYFLAFLGLPKLAFASPGSASFSIAGGTYAIDSSFGVPIYENSGSTSVNVAQAILNYDPSKLQLLNIDTSQSGFNVPISNNNGSGTIKVTRGSTVPVTGTTQLATLNFKVLVDAGSSQLSFVSDPNPSFSTLVIAQGPPPSDIWDRNTTGATYAFTPPPVAVSSPPANTTLVAKPKPSAPAKQENPVSDNVLATTSKLPVKPLIAAASNDNSKNWWAFIGLCSLTLIGLLARLFNLHKKIRASSPKTFLLQVLKRAV